MTFMCVVNLFYQSAKQNDKFTAAKLWFQKYFFHASSYLEFIEQRKIS